VDHEAQKDRRLQAGKNRQLQSRINAFADSGEAESDASLQQKDSANKNEKSRRQRKEVSTRWFVEPRSAVSPGQRETRKTKSATRSRCRLRFECRHWHGHLAIMVIALPFGVTLGRAGKTPINQKRSCLHRTGNERRRKKSGKNESSKTGWHNPL
jgi:hypothetical protein